MRWTGGIGARADECDDTASMENQIDVRLLRVSHARALFDEPTMFFTIGTM